MHFKSASRGREREPFVRKPVALMIKIVLFSKNGSIPSNSMREKTRKGESRWWWSQSKKWMTSKLRVALLYIELPNTYWLK